MFLASVLMSLSVSVVMFDSACSADWESVKMTASVGFCIPNMNWLWIVVIA